MNRKVVFKSGEKASKTVVRYYILAAFQFAASFLLVNFFAEKVLGLTAGVLESIVKFVVDMGLFALSFIVQKRWVFAKKEETV